MPNQSFCKESVLGTSHFFSSLDSSLVGSLTPKPNTNGEVLTVRQSTDRKEKTIKKEGCYILYDGSITVHAYSIMIIFLG